MSADTERMNNKKRIMKKDNNKLKTNRRMDSNHYFASCMLHANVFRIWKRAKILRTISRHLLQWLLWFLLLAYAMWMVYRILNKNKKAVDSGMENIIFDVGQVLVKYDWETYLDSF